MVRIACVTLLLALGSPDACAQTPKKEKPAEKVQPLKAEERQFLVYALADLYFQLPEDIAVRLGRTSISMNRRPPTDSLRMFVKQQEQVFDTLRRHVERAHDEEMESFLQLYRKQLDEYIGFNAKVQKAMQDYSDKLLQGRREAEQRVLLTGIGYALQAAAEGDSTHDAFMRSCNGMMLASLKEGLNLKLISAEHKKRFEENYSAVSLEYTIRIENARNLFNQRRKDLSGDLKTDGKNPFLIVARAKSILTNDDASWKDLLEQAKICHEAVKLVPAGETYDVYRSAFLGVAGLLANASSIKECGATGIPLSSKSVPAAGELALEIWKAYRNVEYNPNRSTRKDFSDDFFQAALVAYAFAGAAGDVKKRGTEFVAILTGQTIIKSAQRPAPNANYLVYTLRREFSSRPDFWFDCARFASMINNTSLAMECLRAADSLGFKDAVEAKSCFDLRNVREDPRTSALFTRLYP
jgi:hypothetical protein